MEQLRSYLLHERRIPLSPDELSTFEQTIGRVLLSETVALDIVTTLDQLTQQAVERQEDSRWAIAREFGPRIPLSFYQDAEQHRSELYADLWNEDEVPDEGEALPVYSVEEFRQTERYKQAEVGSFTEQISKATGDDRSWDVC